jgi:hypothetical protein
MHQYAVKKYSDTFPVIKYLNIYHFVFPSIVPTAHGEVYSIQHYVMKFVRLAAGRCFFPATLVSTTNKTDQPETSYPTHGISLMLYIMLECRHLEIVFTM